MVIVFLKLLVAHCLCDYPLQGDFLSRAKRRGGVVGFPWWLALTSHAIIHGGGVWLVTGSVVLGIAETAMHAYIDFCKCENKIDIVEDQALHVFCKAMWCGLIWFGVQLGVGPA